AQAVVRLAGACCVGASVVLTARLPRLRELVRPIYIRMGILPEMAAGLQTAGELEGPPRGAGGRVHFLHVTHTPAASQNRPLQGNENNARKRCNESPAAGCVSLRPGCGDGGRLPSYTVGLRVSGRWSPGLSRLGCPTGSSRDSNQTPPA